MFFPLSNGFSFVAQICNFCPSIGEWHCHGLKSEVSGEKNVRIAEYQKSSNAILNVMTRTITLCMVLDMLCFGKKFDL